MEIQNYVIKNIVVIQLTRENAMALKSNLITAIEQLSLEC